MFLTCFVFEVSSTLICMLDRAPHDLKNKMAAGAYATMVLCPIYSFSGTIDILFRQTDVVIEFHSNKYLRKTMPKSGIV